MTTTQRRQSGQVLIVDGFVLVEEGDVAVSSRDEIF